ncbi:MAG: M15 family metallopeptidase [bacterium]
MNRTKCMSLIITSLFFILFLSTIQTYSQIILFTNHNPHDSVKISFFSIFKNTNNVKQKFLKAYNKFIVFADDKIIKLKTGQSFVWDDGKKKTFDEKCNNADLEDMVFQNYFSGKSWKSPPEFEYNPGRIRNENFFKAIYGNSESEVRKNCVNINWFGRKIPFNNINGGADSLKAVIKELSLLNKEFRKYFSITTGTLNWRVIAGTKRLSMHSFALAIDINNSYSDYWRNSKNVEYKNRIPIEIVEIFERHGFIWGGKWYNYDTMHFEFRPELLS